MSAVRPVSIEDNQGAGQLEGLSGTRNILIGLALGVLVGLFVGEKAQVFEYVVNAYLGLLQMTVLPYVVVSLIGGIGRLDGARARALFIRVEALALVLGALVLTVVMFVPMTFPQAQSASFFSKALVEPRPPLNLVALYILANLFHSLANNIVPAVVLFSIVVGVALSGVERKEGLLDNLAAIENGLKRANRLLFGLAPVGLFAIAAQTARAISRTGSPLCLRRRASCC
jgi:Na+/H+-dicarboxylate symporter